MKKPELRFGVDPHTFTVIDRLTGQTYPCKDLWEMAKTRSKLEIEHMQATRKGKAA